MESLPLLPGYNFSDPMLKDYKIHQKLKFVNGFRMISDDFDNDHCCKCRADDCSCNATLVVYDPTLTYGRPRGGKHGEAKRFLPHYVLFDRKTLRLDAYFKQGIFGSADEHCRVRQVRILYYLEDDTMAVLEKPLENAGFRQGKLVKKSKIPRPDKPGEFYHWKDLNVACNIEIHGVLYRVVDCDGYTREFLTSQGIDVNDPEQMPADPYLRERSLQARLSQADAASTRGRRSLASDKRFLFLEYNGLVLSFEAAWGEELYRLRYFLDDDTVAVSARRAPGDKAGSSLLLRRTKLPKNWKDAPASYAPVYMERTDEDVREYYGPLDLKVGETVFVFGRRFLLYDCDSFTRKYYADVLKVQQPEGMKVPQLGAAEAPARACREVAGERARDALRRLYNFPTKLRYGLTMEAVRPEDEGREFVLEYDLSDGAIKISELARRNSGRLAGCFLGASRVPKPGADRYYTPEDFAIGARLNVFGHWFVITGTEAFVYKYMLANPQKFDERLRENVGAYLRARGLWTVEGKEERGEEAETEAGGGELEAREGDLRSGIENCKHAGWQGV